MITTLAEVETESIKDWMNLYRRIASEFKQEYVGQIGTLIPGAPVRYSLPHLNILPETIACSDGTAILSYRPVDGDKVVSEVVMQAPISPGATFSYTANTITIRTRETPRQKVENPLQSPRMYILYNQNVPIAFRKQVNSEGKRVVGRKLFFTILIDADDATGKAAGTTGPILKNKLTGLAEQVLQKKENLEYLFTNGYENIKLQSITFFSPENEDVIGLYRGMLIVSTDIFPLAH